MLTHTEEPPTVIDPRFAGMPDIAHGGYTSGLMAGALGGHTVEVRLKRPVRPGRRLELRRAAGELVELRDGDDLLAEARPAQLDIDVPAPVSLAQAEAASARFPGLHHHLFGECFVCGPDRAEGDGLRIFPGPVAGRRLVAAPWVPPADDAGQVPAELVWAAMDCPQLWALMVHAPASTPDSVVTAAMVTRIDHPVVAGEPHVVIAWPIAREGRKWLAGAAIFGPGGELRATGRQTAALVDGWGVPLGRDRWGAEVAAA
jgi:hypothetical protein